MSNRESWEVWACVPFALLCFVIGSEFSILSQPIKYKTNTNRDLVNSVFPCFTQFCFVYWGLFGSPIYFLFLWLANIIIILANHDCFDLGFTILVRSALKYNYERPMERTFLKWRSCRQRFLEWQFYEWAKIKVNGKTTIFWRCKTLVGEKNIFEIFLINVTWKIGHD